MRYLIVETSWPMMRLAADLSDRGVLLSRTDSPEDIPHYLALGAQDLLIAEAGVFGPAGLNLRRLRDAAKGVSIALVDPEPSRMRVAECLAAGADTVVDATMPPDETAARLLAVARRAHGLGSSRIWHGTLQVDLDARAASVAGQRLSLTPKIYEMLEYLALRPGQLVTRDALLNHVYGLEGEPESRVFDVYLCTLRARLREAGADVDIRTARGAGFRLVAPAPSADAA